MEEKILNILIEMNKRLDKVDERFDEIEQKIDDLKEELREEMKTQKEELREEMKVQKEELREEMKQQKEELKEDLKREVLAQMFVFEEEYGKKLTIAFEDLTCRNVTKETQGQQIANLEKRTELNTAYIYSLENRIDKLEKV